MACSDSVKWVITIFKCVNCGYESRTKHRGKSSVKQALKRNSVCVKCGCRDFETRDA